MLTVANIMQAKPKTVSAETPITDLERRFFSDGFTGFPVVRDEKLIGVVSRSDVIRSLLTERSHAEQISEFYSTTRPTSTEEVEKSLESIAAQVGVRLAGLTAEDVMSRNVVTANPTQSLESLARLMLEGHLHRLPVVENERLVGIVTSMDLVAAVANGLLVESSDPGTGRVLPESTQQ